MAGSLPTPRSLATTLINAISSSLPRSEHANPLQAPSSTAKNLLLTLHVLFPTELLPALDLLDRRLVTRLVPRQRHSEQDATKDATVDAAVDTAVGATAMTVHDDDYLLNASYPPLYIIRSAQQQTSTSSHSRFRDATAQQYYEVRTRAWNCSCPAFTFSAFPAALEEEEADEEQGQLEQQQEQKQTYDDKGAEGEIQQTFSNWQFGGASLGKSLPVCKHLLACVLVEHVEALGDCCLTQSVSKEELAGWAAR